MADQTQAAVTQPLPDPEALKPAGLSNKHKRYIYFGVTGVLAILILANVVGSKSTPATLQPRQTVPGQQQNPSPAQIRDWENSLKQAEAQLEQEQKDREQQLAMARASQQPAPLTPDQQLQRAEALQDAATARQQYQQTYGNGGSQNAPAQQKSQTEVAHEQQAYKSLFADNLVRQESAQSASQKTVLFHRRMRLNRYRQQRRSKTAEETGRKPLDFDPAAQPTLWLPEGTVIEAVLTKPAGW